MFNSILKDIFRSIGRSRIARGVAQEILGVEDEGSQIKELEFLAQKSKELIEKQVSSYRQQHSYATTIIGVVTLFIPFFLNGLDDSFQCIIWISIIPIVVFIVALILMLQNLRAKPVDQAFSVDKYQELVNKPKFQGQGIDFAHRERKQAWGKSGKNCICKIYSNII